jgi:hypothetical protein
MDVGVRDGLPSRRAVIRTHVEAIGVQTFMQALANHARQPPYRPILVCAQVEQPLAVAARDNQRVTWGYRKAVGDRYRVGVVKLRATGRRAFTERTRVGRRHVVILP